MKLKEEEIEKKVREILRFKRILFILKFIEKTKTVLLENAMSLVWLNHFL